ncbi:MAG: efflux RND transporter periplasmic adaptor subunit [Beijerinckiaceae bacterium]|jgi:membrane fusion protein, heavy metal efflux system|nr:efflux RND transporter periplasmic adaptor subunit [Beijerinckiaceae bacterium]
MRYPFVVLPLTLIAGLVLGGAVPFVRQAVQGTLAAIGLPSPRAQAAPKGVEDNELGKQEVKPGANEKSAATIKMSPEQLVTQQIQTAVVSGGKLSRHIVVPGTITTNADRVARVPARVVGTVSEMRKRLGDNVERGETVAVLDSREVADAKSEYLTASVDFDLKKTLYERTQALWEKRVAPELQFLQARNTFRESQLRFDLAKQKLSALGIGAAEVENAIKQGSTASSRSSLRQYELRAPLAGRIIERKVDVGTAVGKEGDPADVYTIADLSTVWVELAVPTTDLAKVKEGAEVLIAARDEDAGVRAKGKIIFVSPILNADTRSARVIVTLPNKDLSWRPGTFVSAEIEVGKEPVKMLVNRNALQTIDGEKVAFLRAPEGFERRNVKTGKSDDAFVELVSGLSPGDEIAVANTFLLKAELGKGEAE